MKDRIMLFIIGVLVGAVISTGIFFVYSTTSNNNNMKKTLLLISGLIFFSFVVSAQMNVSVSLNDEIYEFLDVANKKGLCSPLNSYKPYTRSQILQSLREIYDNSEKMNENEIEIVEKYLTEYEPNEEEKKNTNLLRNRDIGKDDVMIYFGPQKDTEEACKTCKYSGHCEVQNQVEKDYKAHKRALSNPMKMVDFDKDVVERLKKSYMIIVKCKHKESV